MGYYQLRADDGSSADLLVFGLDGDVSGSCECGDDGDECDDAGKDVEGFLVEHVLETRRLVVKLVDKVHDGLAAVTLGLRVTAHDDSAGPLRKELST